MSDPRTRRPLLRVAALWPDAPIRYEKGWRAIGTGVWERRS